MIKTTKAIIPFLLAVCLTHVGTAQLSVRTDAYGSKPGYIDQATLVVEPHGAYAEQTLVLSYADHNQFAGSSLVEIVHRFTLPANAVVNDLWLRIGDSLVQAKILDTWTARHIYDSIVTKHRDPAFLSKTGDMYELHIYPLVSGSVRTATLTFITPTIWAGQNGSAELPLVMLAMNNSPIKPLQILFRVVAPVWGTPSITELPLQSFGASFDSAGYKFRRAFLADISSLPSFTLAFGTGFSGGYFFASSDIQNDATYFQLGFDPGSVFGLQKDSTSKHLLFAIDLSGGHNKKFATLIPNLKQLMASTVKSNDSINAVVAGAGSVNTLSPGWKSGTPDSMNAMIDRFAASDFASRIEQEQLPNVLYADYNAAICWQFPGLENLASYTDYSTLLEALQNSRNADVVATYNEGFEDAANTRYNLNAILASADSFFLKGGRVLSYFDYNRVNNEVFATHYISGLTITYRPDTSATLYRNTSGNIGINFPESFVHYGFDILQYTADPSVKVEVQDGQGRPVVISKMIGSGLLVVSSIWSFKDDAAMRQILAVPLLGLNSSKRGEQLTGLLANASAMYAQSRFDRVILLSNSDSLFQKPDALAWTTAYMSGFGSTSPKFTAINLIDGSEYIPPYFTDQLVEYYGSGYLLKTIADATGGVEFETHITRWTDICSTLASHSYPVADSMIVSAVVDSGSGQLKEIREVNPLPQDANKARFFIGSTSIGNSIKFNLHAGFEGTTGAKTASATFFPVHDTTKMDRIVPAMLGNEKLKDLFNQPVRDTGAIVNLAMQYRLLCDYTSFLVLEPTDTVNISKDQNNNTQVDGPLPSDANLPDSVGLSAYPNPFNGQTSIAVTVRRASLVRISIYNILGQSVRVLAFDDPVQGTKTYSWNGRDNRNSVVSSGIYFIHMVAKEKTGGLVKTLLRKIVFLK